MLLEREHETMYTVVGECRGQWTLKVKYVTRTSSKGSAWTLLSDGVNIYKTDLSVPSL